MNYPEAALRLAAYLNDNYDVLAEDWLDTLSLAYEALENCIQIATVLNNTAVLNVPLPLEYDNG